MQVTVTDFKQVSPAASQPVAPNGRIGLVALATDLNSESDLRQLTPPGVEIFTTRVENANPTTLDNLRAMAPDISRAARCLLPGQRIDVLIYGCTSGSIAIGEAEIVRLLQAGRGPLPCTTPVTAAVSALQMFAARRLSILTPYTDAVNRAVVDFFQTRGFEVLNIVGFGIDNDDDMTAVTPDAIYQAALEACRADADALFISCTALRSAVIAASVEAQLGKPVITSNQAILWHALELIGKPYQVSGYGSLFAHTLVNPAHGQP